MIIRAAATDIDHVMFLMIRDAAVSAWISDQLKALCACMKTAPDDQQIHQILSSKTHFSPSHITASQLCCPWLSRYYAFYNFTKELVKHCI